MLLVIAACELAFALVLTREMMIFSADPVSGLFNMLPPIDLAQILNWFG